MIVGPELQSTLVVGAPQSAPHGERVNPVSESELSGSNDGGAGSGPAGGERTDTTVETVKSDKLTAGAEADALASTDFAASQSGGEHPVAGRLEPGSTGNTAPADSPPSAEPVGPDADIGPTVTQDATPPTQGDSPTSNQDSSTEIVQTGNDNRSQTEANRTLGQVIDLFA